MDQTLTGRSKKEKTKLCNDGYQNMQCQPCIIQVPPGPQGKQGASMLSGTGAPANGYGSTGDTYTDLPTGRVYRNIDGQWISTSENLKGEKGEKGDPGPPLSGSFGRMYIDYTQRVSYNLSANWTPIGTTDWVIDYNSYNVFLAQNATNTFSMIRVNLDGVYEIDFNASFDTTDKFWYRLTSTSSGPINGTYSMDSGGNQGNLKASCSTIIWAPAGTAFYAEGYTENDRTWPINYASLKVKMLYPRNTYIAAP